MAQTLTILRRSLRVSVCGTTLDDFRFFPTTRELAISCNGYPSYFSFCSINAVIYQVRWIFTPLMETAEADETLHELETCDPDGISVNYRSPASHKDSLYKQESDDNGSSRTVRCTWSQVQTNEVLERPEHPGLRGKSVPLSSLLKRSGDPKASVALKDVHALIVKSGHEQSRFLANLLVQMYGTRGWFEDARAVFGKIHQRNIYSFNLMMGACSENGHESETFCLFRQAQIEGTLPDKVTFLSTISACASKSNLAQGEQMHACIAGSSLKSDIAVGNALLNMYGKCGSLKRAHRMFDDLNQQDVFSWSSLIAAYAQHGQAGKAYQHFQEMQLEGVIPNKVTFLSILYACSNLTGLEKGQQMYARLAGTGYDSDAIVGTTLVNMYGKCGYFKGAHSVFYSMYERTEVTWNAMILAHSEPGFAKGAYRYFQQMQLEGMVPDKATYVNLLSICTDQALLADGKQIHAHIVGCRLEWDVVGNALINMYGKCGKVEDAEKLFDKLNRQNVVSWNSMAAAYAHHGQGEEALQLLQPMMLEGVNPNEATFSSILSACDHAGLVDEGYLCFVLMGQHHGIMPGVEHYDCMIDLFGRAGQLEKAEKLISSIPFQPCASSWMTLLGSCKVHIDWERGQCAAKHVESMFYENPAPSVLLSNIYASAKNLEGAEKL